ncbi:hypothetical protein IT157_05445, partial [bacterium]|nr:hypothetical protein [bacterium]
MFETAKRYLPSEWIGDSNIVLFEDEDVATDLFPLTVLRPAWEIRAGLGSLWTWVNAYRNHGHAVAHRPRPAMGSMSAMLAGYWEDRLDLEKPTVFLNGRVLRLAGTPPKSGAVADKKGRLLWAKLTGEEVHGLLEKSGTEIAHDLVKHVGGGPVPSEQIHSADFAWDYMAVNE